MAAHEVQDATTTDGSDDLRQADGAVEETQVGTHMAVALQRVGDKRERHGKHGSPGTTDEQEGHDLTILVGHEGNEREANATQHEAHGVGHLRVLEARQDGCPDDGAHGLNGIEHTRPVAGHLILLRAGIS